MHAGSFLRRRLAHSSAKSFHSKPFQLHRSGSASYPRPSSLTFSYPPRRSHSTFPRLSLEEPRKSLSFWPITFALVLLCGGTWLHDKNRRSSNNPPLPPLDQENQDLSSFLGVIDTLKTMPAEIAPGHVGNLTPEQEAKLQEFWVLLLKVCGVNLEGVEHTEDASSSASQKKEQPQQQPKRKGFSLWGGGKSEDDDAASVKSANGISSNLASISISDGDDKYGQSKEFQQALVDMKPEEIRTTLWNMVKHDNPDTLVLRFLRARKWDVKKALIMLISTVRWRLMEINVDDDVMKNGEHLALKQSQSSDPVEKKAGEDFLNQMRLGKGFLHGVDKLGRPICVVRVRLHKPGDQGSEALDRFTVYTIESARMMLAPPVETACVIFDMTNFSLSNMDYNPVKFMIKCFEANYPECLGVVLIHKAPWLFSGIWNIIKGWLDPVVAAKINFTKNVQDLEKFIPKDRIMKELEGDENWEYKYVEPQPGENKAMEDTAKRDELLAERQELAKEVQDATIAWIAASQKKDEEALKAAIQNRSELIERLRVQYWQLDPYIRSRSLYDRLNILQGDGKIDFYPAESK